MFNCSIINLRGTYSTSNDTYSTFHRNMVILMQYNRPPPALKKCYKEGMFRYPNKEGYMQVAYFLLRIVYPNSNEFRDCWPILDKKQERQFTKTVSEMMRRFNNDFSDILRFPEVSLARLMSPGGDRFSVIMTNLSTLAMAVQAKRDLGCVLFNRPSGKMAGTFSDCTKNLRKMMTLRNNENIEKAQSSLETGLENYKTVRKELLDKIGEIKMEEKRFNSEVVEELNKYSLDVELKKKLMDLSSEKGILILQNRISEKENQLKDQEARFNKCIETVKKWKLILDRVVKQQLERYDHVLDGNEIIGQKAFGNEKFDVGASLFLEQQRQVSLVNILKKSHETLKSLKSDSFKTEIKLSLDLWDNAYSRRERVDKEMLELEGKLQGMVLEFTISNDEDLQVELLKPISYSTMISEEVLFSSTPNRDCFLKTPEKISSIPRYLEPSTTDYFRKKMKENIESCILGTAVVPVKQLQSSKSSLEEIMERFRKLRMKREMKE